MPAPSVCTVSLLIQTHKQERKKEERQRKKTGNVHSRVTCRQTNSILRRTAAFSHPSNLRLAHIPAHNGSSLILLLSAPWLFCPCRPPCLLLRSSSPALLLSSSLLDVEDLCRQPVVPVLQLGKARAPHLRLKLLPADGTCR